MKLRLEELNLAFKKSREQIRFAEFHYFYGQMGAGKSTIARMIDYCFGGELEMTPALQNEFVSVRLSARVEENELIIYRERDSDQVRAQWTLKGDRFEAIMPARKAAEEIIPNSGIHVLSDLIFVLSGVKPPKVRKSKQKEESELERLSLRDLLWYCYLDQDLMDSSFFNLEEEANIFKRNKSRDVLRFIVGYHQEEVASLEADLQWTREERQKCEGGAKAMREALESANFSSDARMERLRQRLSSELNRLETAIKEARAKGASLRTAAMETLQDRGRKLTTGIQELDTRQEDILEAVQAYKAQRNSLLHLGSRFRRAQAARAVLDGVSFDQCPSCNLQLPPREPGQCSVCGQTQQSQRAGIDDETLDADIHERVDELDARIRHLDAELIEIRRQRIEYCEDKRLIDEELSKASEQYDSAYLTAALQLEKDLAATQQKLRDLKQIEALAAKAVELEKRAKELAGEEYRLRAALKEARAKAERDTSNLRKLESLFLNCLLRSEIPGFFPDDAVTIRPPHFLPEVIGKNTGDLAVTSFTNLGSGGKKTLFKCCFAVAIHRLAAECGVNLPSLLIIDSPMKNISERENKDQFAGFHQMLHELAQEELKNTQFILVDKELFPPGDGFSRTYSERHMKPGDKEFPPLIPYYDGK